MNKPTATTKRRLNLSWLFYLVMVVTAAITIGSIWKSREEATTKNDELRQLIAENESLSSQLTVLQSQEVELKTAEQNSELWKQQLLDIVFEYRNADDFAENPSNLIVGSVTTRREMSDTIRFSLPEGEHRLKLDISKVKPDTDDVIDQKRLDFDLLGNAGYQLLIDRSEKGNQDQAAQLKILLTSNSELFQNVSESVFEPLVSPFQTQSSGRYMILAFPNQFEPFSVMHDRLQTGASLIVSRDVELGSGFLLDKLRWSLKPPDEEPFDLTFDIRIVSQGPRVLDPLTASTLRTFGANYDVKYFKDGMYEISKAKGDDSAK